MISLIYVAFETSSSRFHLQHQNDSRNVKESLMMKLIEDMRRQLSSRMSLVWISMSDADESKAFRDSADFGTVISSTKINNETINRLKVSHLKDNIPNFFIMPVQNASTEESLVSLMRKVQEVDYTAKLAVIYNFNIDVVKKFEDKKIYNVYFFIPAGQDEKIKDEFASYRMFEVCRFCNDGQDKINQINSWSTSKGFRNPIQFPQSFKNNFYGAEVVMTTLYIAPWFHPLGKNEKGDMVYDGTSYRVYMELGRILNLTWKFLPPHDGNNWRLNSYIEDLNSSRSEVVGGAWIFDYDGYMQADISTGEWYFDGSAIIQVEPLKGIEPTAFITALDKYTWYLMLSLIPSCSLTLYLCRKFGRNPDKPAHFWNCVWEICVVLCWDCIRIVRAPWPVIIVLTVHLFGSMMLVSFYFGEFTAVAVTQKYVKPPLDKLEELWESDYKWISNYEGHTLRWREFFGHVGKINETYMEFPQKFGEPHHLESLRLVMANPDKYVYLYPPEAVTFDIYKYDLEKNERKFYFSKERFRASSTMLYYKKNCYFKEALNAAMMRVQALGLDKHHDTGYKMLTKIRSSLRNPEPPTPIDYVKMKHLTIPTAVFGAWYLLAGISLIGEIIKEYTKERRERKEREEERRNKAGEREVTINEIE